MRYADTKPLIDRVKEAGVLLEKYPDRVPIIVEKAAGSTLPQIDKTKFLVPRDLSVGQFMHVVRKRLKLDASTAIFVFFDKTLPPVSSLIEAVYSKHKAEDGFCYATYSGENVFGVLK